MVKDIRFRVEKYTKKVISKDLYKKWLSENPENSKYSYKDFCNFWKLLANKYTDIVSENPQGVKLSPNMGEISLKYVTSNVINKNYASSNIANTPVQHLNFGTNGKNGKIVWSVAYVRKINPELPLVGFSACREFTIKAGKAFKNTPEIFKISRASKINRQALVDKEKII
jgi:hypothetical protein